ncbi:MAG: DUF6884 domain-containing protein [Patescibacteria group bacterium]|jgi:cytoplasmic iron level regulating protein YaaA (DUF328/UPF0246 family)
MKKIVLIACCSRKLNIPSLAQDLYISPLFKFSLAYAKKLKPDHIFILSAKYGLIALNDKISPYNETLNDKKSKEIVIWADQVIQKLQRFNLSNDKYIFLAGEKYRKYLIPHLKNYEVPLKGLGIGKQLQFLKRQNEK